MCHGGHFLLLNYDMRFHFKTKPKKKKLAIVLTLFDADNGAQLRCPHAEFELKDGLVNSIGQKRCKRLRWMQWQAL